MTQRDDIPTSKENPSIVTAGDTSFRMPIDSTTVIAAALAPGENNTSANPVVVPFREGY